MEIITAFLSTYWSVLILAIVVILGVIGFLRTKTLGEWLKSAVVEAEKLFGSKTGELKLQYVYNEAIKQFPIIATFLPFSLFKKFVDSALDWMEKQIDENLKVKDYIENSENK